MTAKGHLIFSIACAICAKNAELTPILMQGDWWHVIPSAVLTCLLPDIDHPKSFLGRRLKWISRLISWTFGHRGFTHSLLAIFILFTFFYLNVPQGWRVPEDVFQGMVLGYVSHILADILTFAGVPLLWPLRWRFRLPILTPQKGHQLERMLCIALFAYSILIPQNLLRNSVAHWSSQITSVLQFQFNRFIRLNPDKQHHRIYILYAVQI